MTDEDDVANIMHDIGVLDPNHPALARVQELIRQQLSAEDYRLLLELKEKDQEAKTISRQREDVGVELYTFQQQLAKLQETLDKNHDALLAMTDTRKETEKERNAVVTAAKLRKEALIDQRAKLNKYQIELDKLGEKLSQIERYNQEIESEIAIKRRATYKVEENMDEVEKSKKKQDYLIDSLTQQITRLNEQLALFEAQIEMQRREKAIASDTLAEATTEMEAIAFERKQLVQQWKSSIIGMQRRDEALRATEDALRKQKEQELAIENEFAGYKAQIKAEQEKNEKYTSVLTKVENEVKYLTTQIEALENQKTRLHEKYSMLAKSLRNTDEESKKEDLEMKNIRTQIAAIDQQIVKSVKSTRDLEDAIVETLGQQTTLKKGAQSALQTIEKTHDAIRDKEMQVAQIQNELSRVKIDHLQTVSHNEALEDILKEIEADLNQKNSYIEKFELEIRRKHDEIERKQNYLDKLNRKFEQLTAGREDGEDVGPLEATINNLLKAITAKEAENEHIQREWIKYQTELVNEINITNELSDEVKELSSRHTVLTQRKIRLEALQETHGTEIRELDASMRSIHVELNKLNQLISKNSKLQAVLADINYDLENEILARLKTQELECLRLEADINSVREQKKRLVNDLVEIERQIMFWEKKIEIQKETMEAIDPNIGQEELSRMKKEIHIMEQRLQQLQREQKRKIEEMEKAISKREVIATKGRAVLENSKNGTTKAVMKRDISMMEREVQRKRKEAAQKDQQIRSILNDTEATANQAEQHKIAVDELRKDVQALHEEVKALNKQLIFFVDEKSRVQKAIQRYRDLDSNRYKTAIRAEKLDDEYNKAQQQSERIQRVIEEMQVEFPQLREELGSAIATLATNIM